MHCFIVIYSVSQFNLGPVNVKPESDKIIYIPKTNTESSMWHYDSHFVMTSYRSLYI